MGNGPSLPALLEHYKKMDDIDYFALNGYCLTDLYSKYHPSYYIILDPIFFKADYNTTVKKIVDSLNKTEWPMTLFAPSNYKKAKMFRDICNKNISVEWFNYTPIDICKTIDHFFFKYNLGMPCPETVVIAAIFEAINMKFETIHLFGVEHSWLKFLSVDNDNVVSISLQHHNTGTDVDRSKRLHTFLYSQARAFRSNVRLAEYANYRNVNIINHTPGSYLDAYKKQIPEI